MKSLKLLRSRRSSDNRKKRKKKERVENAKRRRSRNARAPEAEKPPTKPDETAQGALESPANTQQNTNETKWLRETAERYHKHALHFFGKWREAETESLRVIEESNLKMTETEIGRGSFGACFLAKYGSRTASKHEARMTARLSHPNTVCFMGIVKRQSRIGLCPGVPVNENVSWCAR